MIIDKKEFDKIINAGFSKFEKLALIADMCRLNTLVIVKKAGSGHLGSSFSAMDLITYLYYEKLNIIQKGIDSSDRDIYFSSKGHDVPGLYSLLFSIGILPLEKLLKLRRLNGLDGHPEISIPGIEASSGSLGMGISKGRGMAWAKKYNNKKGHVYVLVGDGELQEGQIFEALQTTIQQKVSNLTVIVDFNKYQTDKKTDEIVSLGNLEKKIKSFGWYVDRFNGHDFSSIEKSFTKSDTIKNLPKFLIADTIKGKGVSFMEPSESDDIYNWHSGAPDDSSFNRAFKELRKRINERLNKYNYSMINFEEFEKENKVKSSISNEYISDSYSKELMRISRERNDIVVLDGDLSADCKLRDFEITFPNRFIENGIAEQDMVSMAGGIATQGLIPIVNSFSSFLSSRPNEQIYNNATEGNKIIYAFHFSGLIPAGPGKSHQSVRDISLLQALPNAVIFQPSNSFEVKKALTYFIQSDVVVCVLRMNIGPSPQIIKLPKNYKFKKGVGTIIADGKDVSITAYGPVMLNEALIARKILQNNQVSVRVINMPWLNRIEASFIKDSFLLNRSNYILEDHMKTGGLFSHVINKINELNCNYKIECIGLSEFPKCGNPLEVLDFHNLNYKHIVNKISSDLKKEINIDIIENDYSESPQ